MGVTELTKELCDKYHGVYKMIYVYISRLDDKNKTIKYEDVLHSLKFYRSGLKVTSTYLPFNMLYGLLEDFFEENGIIIYVEVYYMNTKMIYAYNILDFKYRSLAYKQDLTKKEAKYQALLKACEILNKTIVDS